MTREEALVVVSKGKDSKFNVCPWQELRLMPYLHYQIDLLLTPEQVYGIDSNLAYMDLQKMYMGLEVSLELKLEYKDIKYHNAVTPKPLQKYWKYVVSLPGKLDPKYYFKEEEVYLFGDWKAVIMDRGYDTLVGTKTRSDGRIQVSYAMLVERK